MGITNGITNLKEEMMILKSHWYASKETTLNLIQDAHILKLFWYNKVKDGFWYHI